MTKSAYPSIGLGTGGADYLSGAQCREVVSTALDLGYRHIDTAVMYDNHKAVGQGIRRAAIPRKEITLATKVPPGRLSYHDTIECIEESREELSVDQIDLVYVHFPSPVFDPVETFSAFNDLIDEGVVGGAGVSNFSVEQLSKATTHLNGRLMAIQAELHPLCQQPDLIKFAQENEICLVGYAPLARGKVLEVQEIAELADKYDVSPAQITLAWIVDRPNVNVIVKSTQKSHLIDNLQAPSLSLDEEDIHRIESISRTERLIDPARYEED